MRCYICDALLSQEDIELSGNDDTCTECYVWTSGDMINDVLDKYDDEDIQEDEEDTDED